MSVNCDKQTLLLGHSPDPDDAFMFYGLAKGLVDSGGWSFEHVMEDIQTLNERALRGELQAFFHLHLPRREKGRETATFLSPGKSATNGIFQFQLVPVLGRLQCQCWALYNLRLPRRRR